MVLLTKTCFSKVFKIWYQYTQIEMWENPYDVFDDKYIILQTDVLYISYCMELYHEQITLQAKNFVH
jgi:hypothetical protein